VEAYVDVVVVVVMRANVREQMPWSSEKFFARLSLSWNPLDMQFSPTYFWHSAAHFGQFLRNRCLAVSSPFLQWEQIEEVIWPMNCIFWQSGYYTNDSLPTVAALCEQADEQMFRSVKCKPTHPLRPLLPPERSTPYCTPPRLHNYELPSKINNIDECNFIYRVLYKDCF